MATEQPPMSRSAVRAKLASELGCYCVFRLFPFRERGTDGTWALIHADRSIDRAVSFALALKCEIWELREPVYGQAWQASAQQKRQLERERAEQRKPDTRERGRDGR